MEEEILENDLKKTCVYCGSSVQLHQDYLEVAYKMGGLLAAHNLEIVYGADNN